LNLDYPYSERMIERAHGKENLENYTDALNGFAINSHFSDFWNSKIPYYRKMVEYTAADLGDYDPVAQLESYYNESKNSYTVTLSPAFAGGYGIRIPLKNDDFNIYGCLNVSEMKDSIPYYNKLELSYFLWHEFGHSFVNPLSEKYKAQTGASSVLYTPIENEMRAKAYGSWDACINEHIIRAIYIRLLNIYSGEISAKSQLIREKSLRYIYIEPLVEKLKQFEKQRDTKNITFSQFYPTLLNVFDSLTHTNNELLINPPFLGPVSSVLGSSKIAIIYPTNDLDTIAEKTIFDYTAKIHSVKKEVSILCADTTALKMDLSTFDIMAYGTIESNLFLNTYKETFPFKIAGNTILTDKRHEGTRLRIIACLPNPTNNKRGMMVNTSASNYNIKGVSNPFTDDYLVFEDIDNILQQGFFKKGEEWTF